MVRFNFIVDRSSAIVRAPFWYRKLSLARTVQSGFGAKIERSIN